MRSVDSIDEIVTASGASILTLLALGIVALVILGYLLIRRPHHYGLFVVLLVFAVLCMAVAVVTLTDPKSAPGPSTNGNPSPPDAQRPASSAPRGTCTPSTEVRFDVLTLRTVDGEDAIDPITSTYNLDEAINLLRSGNYTCVNIHGRFSPSDVGYLTEKYLLERGVQAQLIFKHLRDEYTPNDNEPSAGVTLGTLSAR